MYRGGGLRQNYLKYRRAIEDEGWAPIFDSMSKSHL